MIYLDYNATTPIDKEVLDVMLPFLKEHWHNPASTHGSAKQVRQAIEQAREQVASFLSVESREIIFTSGGVESNATALKTLVTKTAKKQKVLVSEIEHSSILAECERYRSQGYKIDYLPVTSEGRVCLTHLDEMLSDHQQSILGISVMGANHETGVLQNIERIVELAHQRGIFVHSDGVAWVGKKCLNIKEVGVDYFSISGHKIFGPKGVGGLYVRGGMAIEPLLLGNQQKGRRGGTEDVASIVGLGKACHLQQQALEEGWSKKVTELRDSFEQAVLSQVEEAEVVGVREGRVSNTSYLSFRNCEAGGLMILLEKAGVIVSAGSACHAGSAKPSHIPLAMGLTEGQAKSCLRFSFSGLTSRDEVDQVVERVVQSVNRWREVQGRSYEIGSVTVFPRK